MSRLVKAEDYNLFFQTVISCRDEIQSLEAKIAELKKLFTPEQEQSLHLIFSSISDALDHVHEANRLFTNWVVPELLDYAN